MGYMMAWSMLCNAPYMGRVGWSMARFTVSSLVPWAVPRSNSLPCSTGIHTYSVCQLNLRKSHKDRRKGLRPVLGINSGRTMESYSRKSNPCVPGPMGCEAGQTCALQLLDNMWASPWAKPRSTRGKPMIDHDITRWIGTVTSLVLVEVYDMLKL